MKRIRAVLCGEDSVGKSSIIKRFATGTFSDSTSETVAGAFHSQLVRFNNETLALEIWDTAGSERYHSVIPSFFKNAAAVVVVYDLTSRPSFDNVPYWLNFARDNTPESAGYFLVRNKTDLFSDRAVAFEEGKALSDGHKLAAFAETSAKTGKSIDNLFTMLADVRPKRFVEAKVRGEVISLDRRTCC
jgi:small GTP-binding protein